MGELAEQFEDLRIWQDARKQVTAFIAPPDQALSANGTLDLGTKFNELDFL